MVPVGGAGVIKKRDEEGGFPSCGLPSMIFQNTHPPPGRRTTERRATPASLGPEPREECTNARTKNEGATQPYHAAAAAAVLVKPKLRHD